MAHGCIGILGGTFDPVHYGHLSISREVGEKLRLDTVFLLPALIPPHKSQHPVTPYSHRLKMLELALQGQAYLQSSALEAERTGPSYTIDTFRKLHQIEQPTPEYFFILGLDAFADIQTWKEYGLLLNYTNLVVCGRPGQSRSLAWRTIESYFADYSLDETEGCWRSEHRSGKLIFLEVKQVNISSTMVRELVAAGENLENLVPPPVAEYIKNNRLYTKAQDDTDCTG